MPARRSLKRETPRILWIAAERHEPERRGVVPLHGCRKGLHQVLRILDKQVDQQSSAVFTELVPLDDVL